MNNVRPAGLGQLRPDGRSPKALAVVAGLAALLGCATTRTIPAERLPDVVAPQAADREVTFRGDDGKRIDLPAGRHLRWVQIETRSGGEVQEIEPPVSARVTGAGLHIEGKGVSRTYPLSDIRSVQVRHDDHRGDTTAGIALLTTGALFATGAAVTATFLVATIKDCDHHDDGFDTGCLWMMVPGLGAGVGALAGIGMTISGGVLLHRGLTGRDLPRAEQTGHRPAPQLVIGPGSAALTVPF